MKPCITCQGYNKYVSKNVFINQPDTITIRTWDDDDAFVAWEKEQLVKNDVVNAPKHYMLFEDKGIEVRHVIEKLVIKIQKEIKNDDYPQGYSKPMFVSDYVQMMQYLMRFMDKNGKEDLEKARWYLDKLLEAYE
jgi:hypothetical protein